MNFIGYQKYAEQKDSLPKYWTYIAHHPGANRQDSHASEVID